MDTRRIRSRDGLASRANMGPDVSGGFEISLHVCVCGEGGLITLHSNSTHIKFSKHKTIITRKCH
jgi:hypothetical protein